MGLIRFFARQAIFVNIFAISIILAGFITFFKSPKEIFPNIEFGIVVVTTIYPQASSDEIEKLVTDPIEDAVKNISGVKEITSASSEALSMIVVQANEGHDIKQLSNDMKAAIDKISTLPDEAHDPEVFDISSEEFGLIMMTVSGGEYADRRETARLIENRTSKIRGIGKLEKWGYSNKAIWVETGKKELEKYGLTIFSLINVLKDRNISMPAGNIRIDGKELAVRFLSEQLTASEISRIIIRSNDAGYNIRIGDVASVSDGFTDEDAMFRAGGEEAILLVYNKMQGYDAVKMTKEIRQAAKELEKTVSKDVKVTFTDDFSERLKDRLNVLYSNGAFGASMVILLLLIFMRPSVALMVSIGLPVALGASFLVTSSIGITFNMLSLFAFIMVIGMLVDDAIVVGENMYRHMEMGKKPFNAAVDGASEMIIPVIASVSTTAAAFLPLLMVGGMIGKMMGVVPVIISIALAMSVIECFFILPSHLADFVKQKKEAKAKSDRWFSVLRERYGKALVWVVSRRKRFGAFMILMFFLAVAGAVVMDKKFADTQINEVIIKFDAPTTMGLEDTAAIVKEMEDRILTLPEDDLENVISYVGYQQENGPPKFAPNLAYIRVLLKLEGQRKTRDANKIVAQIKEMTGERKDFSKFSIEVLKAGPSHGADISMSVTGDTFEEIGMASGELAGIIKEIETKKMFKNEFLKPVVDVNTDLETGKKEIRFVVDEPKAMRAGVNIGQVATILRAAIAGLKVKSIKTAGENVDIMVRIREEEIKSVEDILSLTVPNMMGRMIPLRSIVKEEEGFGYSVIRHKDGKKSVTVTGTVDKVKGNAARVNVEIMKKLDDLKLKYPSVEFVSGGEFQAMMDAFGDLAFAFFVALLIIFAILATLFNSVTQPVIIMLAIPFGFIGVVATLLLHGSPITFMAFMGFVGLTGVVVNNSILMTTFIDRMKKGLKKTADIEKAVIDGAMARFRPIILTAITTSVGLMPIAYGWFGGNDPFLQPMALVFSWGILFASLVTLFIIPVFIVIWNNALVKIKHKAGKQSEHDRLIFVSSVERNKDVRLRENRNMVK
ncbi:MAG TPA: efflux RND transporter permease subunit [bacterium]|nr:efflux RND transporter permease subunit [bacterium]